MSENLETGDNPELKSTQVNKNSEEASQPQHTEEEDDSRLPGRGDITVIPPSASDSGSPTSTILINPTAMEALAQKEPNALIEFVDASDNRLFQYSLAKEQNRSKEEIE